MQIRSPRIVIYDIETVPNLPEALKVWPQLSNYPGQTFKASINSIACFGWKILGEETTNIVSAWDFPEWTHDVNNDEPILRRILEIFDGADGVITQNGKAFDEKFIQTRLLLNEMDIMPKYAHLDTKLLAKKFSFFSNSLKYLTEQLTDTRKLDNSGWDLWCRVHARDHVACAEMATYCKGDVDALEAVYRRLRVASTGANKLPNHNLFLINGSRSVCPHCGSTRSVKFGLRYNNTRSYQRYRCNDCRAYFVSDASDKNPRAV